LHPNNNNLATYGFVAVSVALAIRIRVLILVFRRKKPPKMEFAENEKEVMQILKGKEILVRRKRERGHADPEG
jgi:hypothetical protein